MEDSRPSVTGSQEASDPKRRMNNQNALVAHINKNTIISGIRPSNILRKLIKYLWLGCMF